MPEQDYSKREIDILFGEIKDLLVRIEAQTIKTNGRVTKMEGWNQTVKGAATVITVVATMVSGLLVYIYTKDMDMLNKKIDNHVSLLK